MTKHINVWKILVVIGLILFPFVSAQAQPADKEVPLRYSDSSSGGLQSFIANGTVKNFLSVSEGYDNNVYLNSAREADPFTQIVYKTTFTSPLNDQIDVVLGYGLMSLLYAQETKVDLIKNGISMGIEDKLSDKLKLTAAYSFDVVDYPNTAADDFFDHKAEFKLKQDLPYKIYHSVGYEFLFRDYNKRQTRVERVVDFFGFPLNLGLINTGKKRDDIRNSVEYEIGKYFEKDLLKVGFQYFYNDSSERFLNYYDYDSYKPYISITHVFNEKVFGFLSFSDQYRFYRSRVLSTNQGSLERDRTYISTAALFYNITKALTLGLNYTYRENDSNEPIENYSGSLITLGAFYKF